MTLLLPIVGCKRRPSQTSFMHNKTTDGTDCLNSQPATQTDQFHSGRKFTYFDTFSTYKRMDSCLQAKQFVCMLYLQETWEMPTHWESSANKIEPNDPVTVITITSHSFMMVWEGNSVQLPHISYIGNERRQRVWVAFIWNRVSIFWRLWSRNGV